MTGRSAHTHTHTDRQTDKQKRTHYLRHSLRSLGGDNKVAAKWFNWYWQAQCRADGHCSGQSRGPSSQTCSRSWQDPTDIAVAASVTRACCELHTDVVACCRPWCVDSTPDCTRITPLSQFVSPHLRLFCLTKLLQWQTLRHQQQHKALETPTLQH